MTDGGDKPGSLEGASVSYVAEWPCGRVVFVQGTRRFELYSEFCGGAALAAISVPGESEWVARTGYPLAERAAVLEFIARAVVRDKTGGRGMYEIDGGWITVYP